MRSHAASRARIQCSASLQSLCENSKLAQFCSARFQAGTEGRGDTKNARLKGGRYKTVPILSSHTDSLAPEAEASGVKTPDRATFSSGLKSRPPKPYSRPALAASGHGRDAQIGEVFTQCLKINRLGKTGITARFPNAFQVLEGTQARDSSNLSVPSVT